MKKALKSIIKKFPNNIPIPEVDNETNIPCYHTAKEFYNMTLDDDHIPTSETYWKFSFTNVNKNIDFKEAYKLKIIHMPDNKLK